MKHQDYWLLRALAVVALATFASLALPTAAVAKMPYFTIETSPAEPRPNEPILVVVRTWADAVHTVPGGSDDWTLSFAASTRTLDLVVRSAGAPDIPVHLVQVQADRFEGTISLPAGDWTLDAFPDRSGWPTSEVPAGYPDKITLAVHDPAHVLPTLLLVLVALLGVVGLVSPRVRSLLGRGPRGSAIGRAFR